MGRRIEKELGVRARERGAPETGCCVGEESAMFVSPPEEQLRKTGEDEA